MLAGRRPARLFTVLCFTLKSSGSSEFSNRWLSWFQMYLVHPGDDYEIYFWAADPRNRTSERSYGKIRDSEQSSVPQANIPLAIILEKNTVSLKLGYPTFITGMVVYLVYHLGT